MKKKMDIVDLVESEDGTYRTDIKTRVVENRSKLKSKLKQKDHSQDFFDGLDAGLDFVEGIGRRVDRFMKIRG